MKKGSGSDPFADVQDDDAESESDGSTESEEPDVPAPDADDEAAVESDETDGADESTPAESAADGDGGDEGNDKNEGDEAGQAADNGDTDSNEAVIGAPPQVGADDDGVPWVYVRDNVKQDREMVQFYLRDYVVEAEDEFVDAVSDELGTDVSKTDVREAAYEAAMHNVDEVVERLQAWGFESTD